MFRNQTLQRAVSSVLLASFVTGLLAPLAAAAQTAPKPVAMVGSVPLVPLQAPTASAIPVIDANGIPTGKGAKKRIKAIVPVTAIVRHGYGDAVGDLHELARKSDASLRTGKGDALAMANALRAQYGTVLKQESQMAAGFAATETYLRAHGVPSEIVQRNTAVASQFGERSAGLRKVMTALDAAAAGKGSPRAALGQLSKWLEQHPSQSGQQGHAKGALPWGQGQKAAQKVALSPRQHEDRFPRSIELAAAGSISGITLPDAILPAAVQPADLAASDDAPVTPEIVALSTSLGKNPVAINNWVRNEIRYAPGYGAMQGAAATLKARRGNDVDTASLLIALYRAAGIPARYVYGTIEVPAARMNNWLGVDNSAASLAMLTQAGIPNRSTAEAVQLEHMWVEAFVDYSPSRGAVNKVSGTWVPMDPSFKQMNKQPGMNLRAAISLNEAGLFDAVKQGATCTVDYARDLNIANLQQGYTGYKNQLDTYLTQQGADLTVGQVLGSEAIAPENYGILMGTLPYTVVAQGAVANVLPDQLRWKFHLQLYPNKTAQGEGESTAAFSSTLAGVADKRLTLSFVPATELDANTLALYLPKAHADQSAVLASEFAPQIPGYLIRVKAEIRLDGAVVASGGSFVLGSELVADIGAFDPSSGNWNDTTFSAHAGDYHAVAIDAQGIVAGQLNSAKARLNSLQAKLAAGQSAALSRDDVSGELLYQGALAYFATMDANGAVFQRAAGVVEQRLPSYGRAVAQVQPEMVLGIVNNVTFPGVVLDIDRVSSAVASLSAGTDSGAYVGQANQRNAAYAHQVLARMFTSVKQPGMAVSPVRSLAMAAAAGQTVYAVTGANSASVLPQLTLSASAGADLENDTAAGLRALVAKTPVSVGGWTGQGIATEDPSSGAGSFRLSGETGNATAALYPAGGMGWLALAAPNLSAGVLAPVAQAGQAMDATLAGMLDVGTNTTRWSFFPGQAETVNGLFLARLAQAQGGQPCDSLAVLVAADLTAAAGFDKGSVAGAPVITSAPVIVAGAGQGYHYAVLASDPQGGALAYSLVGAPTGMSIGDSGVITWLKPVSGSYGVTVRADNGKAYAEQRYQLGVSVQALELSATLVATPAVVNIGETVEIDLVTNGGTGNIAMALSVDGQAVAIDNMGHASVTATVKGAHQITGTATDSLGKVTRAATYSVRDLADSTMPVAMITSPVDDAEVTAPVNVTGTASATNMAYYQLLLRLSGNTAWTEIARGTSAVNNGVLGKLDPTQLANGIYELVLMVTDANGNKQSSFITVDIYRDLKIGQFSISFEDLNVEASGIPIRVTRTYDTRKKGENLDFGYGWTVDYQSVQVRKNMVLGLQWNVQVRQFLLCLVPAGKRKINITLPDGKVERFIAANEDECAFGTLPDVDIKLSALPGTTSRLEIANVPALLARGGQLYDVDKFEPWNPKEFKLTTEDNYVYSLTEGLGITQVRDPSGNTLTYGQNGIVHSNGSSVAFTRDNANRITAISDPAGKSIRYSYSTAGDLISVTDRTDAISKLSYNRSHGLTDFTDPMGNVTARYVYDTEGRVIAVYDADGKAIETTHDTANNEEIIKDRRGNVTTYRYDGEGNVTEKIDALNNRTTFQYDVLGNVTSLIDAYGKTTTSTFDAWTGKQLSQKDALGHELKWDYDKVTGTQLQHAVDARGNSTEFNYADNGGQSFSQPLGRVSEIRLGANGEPSSMSAAGHATSFTHGAKGQRLSQTDAAGNVTTFAYDDNGRQVSQSWSKTIGAGIKSFTTTQKIDAEGRVLEETDALGFTTRRAYNAGGQLVTRTDPQGRVTRFEYNPRGKLARTVYPDASSESIGYDAVGNMSTSTDRQGRQTAYEYDALNRLTKTVSPDGVATGMEYDALGRVTATVDGKQRRTVNKYDDIGRLEAVTDPELNVVRYGYDESGNRSSVTDANLKVTSYKYDALSRLILTTAPDGRAASIVWNIDGTRRSESDFGGNSIAYGYDTLGSLASVTETVGATVQTTAFKYDELGARTSKTDAEGRTTRWTYDGESRPTSRTLPDGQTEQLSYDAVGNMTGKVDFAGKTTRYAYNSLGDVIQAIRPDGVTIAYTYTPAGKLATSTVIGNSDVRSGVTSYTYDVRDRLVRQVNPDAGFLAYAYDPNDNVTERSSAAGTIVYGYDNNQRLSSVTGTDGKTTRYRYTPTGEVSTVAMPNGIAARYHYDISRRLEQLVHVREDDSIVTGVRFGLEADGQRSSVSEYDGQSVLQAGVATNPARTSNYRYDAAKRLTQEQVVLRSGQVASTVDYTYDKVGNRTRKVLSAAGIVEVIDYTYDGNDRLSGERKTVGATVAVLTAYGWDSKGNLRSKSVGGMTWFFTWSSDNRLLAVKIGQTEETAQLLARYIYDASGNRVVKVEPGAAGEPEIVTNYVVDEIFPDAQTVAQVVMQGGSSERTNFLWGKGLIQQTRGGLAQYAHADSLGSIKAMSDENGVVVSQVVYDAFGMVQNRSGSAGNVHGFGGEYFDDAVGLQYNRARWYDANIGRFLSEDTWDGLEDEPATLHKYAFNHNDPVNRTDPSGNTSLGELSVTMDGNSIVQTSSLSAGRKIITKVLFGQPPKDIGIVGEMVLDWMTQGFFDHIYDGGITKQEFGSRVHKELKSKCLAFAPLRDVKLECEPYFDKSGPTQGNRNTKGSLGVDVLIRYKGKPVIAFELKTGKGMTKSGIAKRQKWIGASVIQVTFKSTKG
jgi:RHS repeat-associated protein